MKTKILCPKMHFPRQTLKPGYGPAVLPALSWLCGI